MLSRAREESNASTSHRASTTLTSELNSGVVDLYIISTYLLYIFTASRRAAKLITPNPVRPTPSSRGGAALCHAGPAVAMAPH